MALTIVPANAFDFRDDVLSNITDIVFDMPSLAFALFSGAQFDDLQVSKSVHITGDAVSDQFWVQMGSNPGAFSAASWSFTNWTANDSVRMEGSSGADTITGPSPSAGTVYFEGHGGADILIGGSANNIYDFLTEEELSVGAAIIGGTGSDQVRLWDESKVVDFDLSTVNMSSVETVSLEMRGLTPGLVRIKFDGDQIGLGAITTINASDWYDNIITVSGNVVDLSAVTFANWGGIGNHLYIEGTTEADTLTGSSQRDEIRPGDGNDAITAGDGDDVIEAGAGNDQIDGGDGQDKADYGNCVQGVVVDLTVVGAQDTGGGGTDSLTAIEHVQGSATGANQLTGNDSNNQLSGITLTIR